MVRKFVVACTLLGFASILRGQDVFSPIPSSPWADSVLTTMSLDEKIGQLFMVAAYSRGDKEHEAQIQKLISEHDIGGLIFFQCCPETQVKLTNRYQEISKYPLLIGQDFEWGLGMRLDSTLSFPKQMTLGAISNDSLIYEMGREIAREMKQLGVHINFAPVVDVNNNPANPVIGYRSFGENKQVVARKSLAYMSGLQDNGIMANAKHFPGHGDTNADSHHTLPVIKHSKKRMDTLELFPFRHLMKNGLMSVMVAHLNIPAYDADPKRPTTLSRKVVNDLLRKKMGFSGLIFTDALNMRGVTDHFEPGIADLLAFNAGNDILLFPEDVPRAITLIKEGVASKKIREEQIDARVLRILQAKKWAGLDAYKPASTVNLLAKINSPEARQLNYELYRNAATLVANDKKLIPVKVLDTLSIGSLSLNAGSTTEFQKVIQKYAPVQNYDLKDASEEETNSVVEALGNFDLVVVGVHGMNNSYSRNFGVTPYMLDVINRISDKTRVILSVFGNPYSLKDFKDQEHLLCLYQENDITQSIAAQIIFGGISAKGKLPVTPVEGLNAGTGIFTESLGRLGYQTPEAVGMDSKVLDGIDEIIEEAIREQATPGAQVLVARKGKIVFERSYGYYTYDSAVAVDDNTIYDVASVTKVVATLQAAMFLEERGLIDMNKKASHYLPELKITNKKDMILRDILTHQAGLWPYLPYWSQTVTEGEFDSTFYRINPDEEFNQQVSLGLYAKENLGDSVWYWTVDSKVREKEYRTPYDYKYSDMGFYILKRIAEKFLNQPIQTFLEQNFYAPLGLQTTCYLPLCKFPIGQIAPTEDDIFFRKTLVAGMVHDQGAAMTGGVAGHAGIFSNANDLAKIMAMNLNDGEYGGVRYLQEGTVSRFSGQQYRNNRRGMGWDKPADYFNGPTSMYASPETFGHTGFTGTAVWADPTHDLIFIFLSNRIFPDASNAKLIRNNIRTRIMDLIYQSVFSYEKTHNW